MKSEIVVLFIGLVLLSGCSQQTKWNDYTDGQFMMQYPDGSMQPTQGQEIFKEYSICMVSVSKFPGQSSFSSFTSYMKGLWAGASGLTVESEYETANKADFQVRASNATNSYGGSIRLMTCDNTTMYVVLVGCDRAVYEKNKDIVDHIIDSSGCRSPS